jgi:hypothetical protein
VECGFLTNPTEAQYAQSASYRQLLAQNIARGILNKPAIATRTSYTNRSSHVDVGLQPFLDQRYLSSSSSKHRKSSKASKKKKSIASGSRSKKKKPTTSATDEQ